MARLPDVMDLGAPVVPRRARGIVSDQSAQIQAEALGNFAGTVGNIAAQFREREDKFTYALAKSKLLQADIQTRKSLEDDPDFETYEKRYQESMTKALGESSKLIRGSRDRALFDMDAKLDVERGTQEIRAQAKTKEIDWGRSTLDQTLEANRAAALQATDDNTRQGILNSSKEQIQGAVDRGYYKQQDGTNIFQRFRDDFSTGYLGMQTPEKRVELLKGAGSVADFLQPDVKVNLLREAENEIRIEKARRDAESKRQMAEARLEINERLQDARAAYRLGLTFDNAPSRSEIRAAYGDKPDQAERIYKDFINEQQLGADLQVLANIPDGEQDKLLKERAPTGTAGVADAAERYRVLASRTNQLRDARDRDPASYVMTYNPKISQAFADSDTPEGAQAYAKAAIAEQQRLGVKSPQLLPKEVASEIVQQFYKQQNGEGVAGLIQSEQQKWGKYWPQVYGQLSAQKLPAAAMAIGRGMNPGAASRLASIAAISIEELRKGVETPKADVTSEIEGKFSQFRNSLDGLIGSDKYANSFYTATEQLAYSYLRRGDNLESAVEQAYNEVIGDHYAFHNVNGKSFRVPVEYNVRGLDSGVQRALTRVPVSELQAAIPTSTGTQEAASADLQRAIRKHGYWVTSADQEKGLALFLDGAPVLRKDGSVYEVTWDQLLADIEATRGEIQRAADEIAISRELR